MRSQMRIESLSRSSGKRYAISISAPDAAAPAGGHPALLVLDGDSYFAPLSAAAGSFPPARQALIVGIGYPLGSRWVRRTLKRRGPVPEWLAGRNPRSAAIALERLHDLTLPSSNEALAEELLPGTGRREAKDVGGMDLFLDFLVHDLIADIARSFPLDRDNISVFGHSLGGLAVLRMLFTRPAAFKTLIASSPSIWWGRRAVLAGEQGFGAKLQSARAPRLLITVGAREGCDTSLARRFSVPGETIDAINRNHGMQENARELAYRLQGLAGGRLAGQVEFVLFEGFGHELAAWPAMALAIDRCFG